MAWAAGSVCDLYKARWEIEVFFNQVKQTLRLGGFLGYRANAMRWQVWTALPVYMLLRFAAHLSQWGHSFTRLFAVMRAAVSERLDALGLLQSYGTAGGSFNLLGAAQFADGAAPAYALHSSLRPAGSGLRCTHYEAEIPLPFHRPHRSAALHRAACAPGCG